MSTYVIEAESNWETARYFDYFKHEGPYGQMDLATLVTLAEGWENDGLITDTGRSEIEYQFNATERTTLNIVPGFSVIRGWSLNTVIDLEERGEGQLEAHIIDALAAPLDTWEKHCDPDEVDVYPYLTVTTFRDIDISRHWAGLPLLDRLLEGSEPLTSQEVARLLGARSIKGIGSVLRPTRATLERAGIRFDEAVRRRIVQRQTVWTAGKRIHQARHVLDIERRRFARAPRGLAVLAEEPEPDYRGPVLVLRALKTWGDSYRVDGGMAELDCLLGDELFDPVADKTHWRVGEVFIERIEPAETDTKISVPPGYEENGIWVRGEYDYAHPHVAGAIGTGRSSTMIAFIGEAAWVERRMPLINAARQAEAVRIREG